MRREENLTTATMFSLAMDTNVVCLSLLLFFFFYLLAGDNLSRVANHVVFVSLETNHKVICSIIHQQDTRKSGRGSPPGVLMS